MSSRATVVLIPPRPLYRKATVTPAGLVANDLVAPNRARARAADLALERRPARDQIEIDPTDRRRRRQIGSRRKSRDRAEATAGARSVARGRPEDPVSRGGRLRRPREDGPVLWVA